MSRVKVLLYCDSSGSSPFIRWFDGLPQKAKAKCLARIERLAELGHELKRPDADYLNEDIYELRVRLGSVNYRMLYFFHGRDAVVVSHGFTKQRARVPTREIQTAITQKQAFEAEPEAHTYKEEH